MTPESTGTELAHQAADRAQDVMSDATDSAIAKARTQLDQRSTQVGEQVTASADALRKSGDQLRQQGNQAVAQVTDEAARQAQRLGSYLEQADADRIVSDVEQYARQNPWAVVIGGVIAGAAAARFLKASSTRRYQQDRPSASSALRPSYDRPTGPDAYDRPIGSAGRDASTSSSVTIAADMLAEAGRPSGGV
jgi:ElaB/YqjD/DUF883 family membrane-anchored ribosome-binding protein